jgi:hypothetical protein
VKEFTILILLSFFLADSFAQHKKISALFIGNSYTQVNNLPQVVDNISTAAGDTLDWDISASAAIHCNCIQQTQLPFCRKIVLKYFQTLH